MSRVFVGRLVATAGAVVLLSTAVAAPPAAAATTTARSLAMSLQVKKESGSSTYDRSAFRHWVDADGDGCHTRAEVLAEESHVPVTYGSGCSILSGEWHSPYDGGVWTVPSDVDIDHVVALKEAWESGARLWDAPRREAFANDLAYAPSLLAVTDNVNASKADSDPAQWLPPLESYRCEYAVSWATVKYRWKLTVDSAERETLLSVLSGTCGEQTVEVPPRH